MLMRTKKTRAIQPCRPTGDGSRTSQTFRVVWRCINPFRLRRRWQVSTRRHSPLLNPNGRELFTYQSSVMAFPSKPAARLSKYGTPGDDRRFLLAPTVLPH